MSDHLPTPTDIEAIERATLAAVACADAAEIGGWLAPLNAGTIGRAKSAVPLRHDLPADPATLDALEAAYAERGLTAAFRLADVPGLGAVRTALAARGYAPDQPTLVKIGAVADMARAGGAQAEVADTPPDGWADVFLGPGFDAADGAHRVAVLGRSAGAVYAGVRRQGRMVAVGVASFAHGWASVHGMRTDQAWRGQGLAGQVLEGLAAAAQARGVARVFLQVEEGNVGARSLYRARGLAPAWRYSYWRRP